MSRDARRAEWLGRSHTDDGTCTLVGLKQVRNALALAPFSRATLRCRHVNVPIQEAASAGARTGRSANKGVRVAEVFTPSVPAGRGFVGREVEMKDLRTKGLRGPGTQIVVWGESGAGKSSLINKALLDEGLTAVKTSCTPDSTYSEPHGTRLPPPIGAERDQTRGYNHI